MPSPFCLYSPYILTKSVFYWNGQCRCYGTKQHAHLFQLRATVPLLFLLQTFTKFLLCSPSIVWCLTPCGATSWILKTNLGSCCPMFPIQDQIVSSGYIDVSCCSSRLYQKFPKGPAIKNIVIFCMSFTSQWALRKVLHLQLQISFALICLLSSTEISFYSLQAQCQHFLPDYCS